MNNFSKGCLLLDIGAVPKNSNISNAVVVNGTGNYNFDIKNCIDEIIKDADPDQDIEEVFWT